MAYGSGPPLNATPADDRRWEEACRKQDRAVMAEIAERNRQAIMGSQSPPRGRNNGMPWSIAGGAIGSVLVGGGTITTPSTPQWMGVAQRYNAEQQQQAYLQALAIQQYLGQGIDQGLGQSVLQPWQQPGYQGLEVAPTQAEAVPAEPPPPGKRELDLDQIREVEAPKIVAREIEL